MYQISTLHYVKKHWLGSSVLRIWSHLLRKSLMENFIFLYSEYLGGLTSKPQPLLQILEKTEKLGIQNHFIKKRTIGRIS